MAVLNRGGDQTPGTASDEPGRCASEPAGSQRAPSIVRDAAQAAEALTLGVHPGDEGGEVASDHAVAAGFSVPLGQLAAARKGANRVGEEQAAGVQPFEHADRPGDDLDDDPGVRPRLPLGDLVAVLVLRALEVEPLHQPQPRGRVERHAAPPQVEHFTDSRA